MAICDELGCRGYPCPYDLLALRTSIIFLILIGGLFLANKKFKFKKITFYILLGLVIAITILALITGCSQITPE